MTTYRPGGVLSYFRLNMWPEILGNIAGGIVGAIGAYLLFRLQAKHDRNVFQAQLERWRKEDSEKVLESQRVADQARRRERFDHAERIAKAIEPLYRDLGTLYHHCSKRDYTNSIKHINIMDERQKRGEYDLSLAPELLRSYWETFYWFLVSYRDNGYRPNSPDQDVQVFLNSQVNAIAQRMQMELTAFKNYSRPVDN